MVYAFLGTFICDQRSHEDNQINMNNGRQCSKENYFLDQPRDPFRSHLFPISHLTVLQRKSPQDLGTVIGLLPQDMQGTGRFIAETCENHNSRLPLLPGPVSIWVPRHRGMWDTSVFHDDEAQCAKGEKPSSKKGAQEN